MAFRPDQSLLSVAKGHSKWANSYQIADDGSLVNKERFFHLHVQDWEDAGGAECLCYSQEGRQSLATKSGSKTWKRKIQQHALGAWSPWTKVMPNQL